MSDVHIHLLLNHAPAFCLLVGLMALVVNLRVQSKALHLTGLLLMLGGALLALPVYFTGEGAEEAVEHLPLVTKSLIEAHEHAAKTALFLTELTGLLSLWGAVWVVRNQKLPKLITLAMVIAALVSIVSIINVGMLGGQIRHSEIRHAASGQQALPLEAGEHREQDDD